MRQARFKGPTHVSVLLLLALAVCSAISNAEAENKPDAFHLAADIARRC
jgi:hypothetical protein